MTKAISAPGWATYLSSYLERWQISIGILTNKEKPRCKGGEIPEICCQSPSDKSWRNVGQNRILADFTVCQKAAVKDGENDVSSRWHIYINMSKNASKEDIKNISPIYRDWFQNLTKGALQKRLSRFFVLTESGGTPSPLTDNHCAHKSLAERGGTPPLNGQNPLSSFWRVP